MSASSSSGSLTPKNQISSLQQITSTNGSSGVFREKYIAMIETIFNYRDETNKPFEKPDSYWDELFLLKINIGFLENTIVLQTEEELMNIEQTILNPFCLKCLFYLNDDSQIRRANAIQTLCIIFKGLFSKKWNNFSVRIMSLVCGFQSADEFFKILLSKSCQLLLKDVKKVKQMTLALFIILLTGADNANQNAIIDYFTLVDVFEPLLFVIEDPSFSGKMKKNAIICLSLLCNYRKYETDNKYIAHIGSIQKPSSMIALADVITKFLLVWNEDFEKSIEQPGIVNYVWSSIFGSSTEQVSKKARSVNEISGSLLLLYELANHNKDFVGSMTRSLAQISDEKTDSPKRNIKDQLDELQKTKTTKLCPLIFQEFLKFTSILFQEPFYTTKHVNNNSTLSKTSEDITSQYYTHFCLLVILCLIEKKVFRKYIFDINTKLDFFLFKKEKAVFVKNQYNGYGTLAKVLMELLIDFIFHHLQRKHFPVDLAMRALSAIHLLICQSRKYRVRFAVDWDTLWKALTMICDIIAKDNCSKDKEKASQLLEKVLKLFNLGILKGEAFLPTRKHHEQMIYHFVRQSAVFDELLDWMERNLKKVNTNRQLLTNVSMIISEIGEEIYSKYGNYPSEDQVFTIIRESYPKLKLNDFQTLEEVDEYVENPNEVTFFSQLLRVFIFDCKQLVNSSFQKNKNTN
ncbi:predicted protein [Naegleria gruberi]|uniref:Predicted protein n=1 Tax=Naegleria gruberi TaxID=5762 RepID=D2V4V5_NAEGR|nr:uncharacterized protein NAEGRDRAFT_63920 [Naegleria gruberi]EFC48169.1 predicted protein [Naegleria gruberi]|eukprot:XP_002680913.1 predicted protein [Naegleria gruberi strain NEG-M]